MRISDWSSDVCSSDLGPGGGDGTLGAATLSILPLPACKSLIQKGSGRVLMTHEQPGKPGRTLCRVRDYFANHLLRGWAPRRKRSLVGAASAASSWLRSEPRPELAAEAAGTRATARATPP